MKNIFLVLALCGPVIVFSQSSKVLVPYRDGRLWGYSDTLGKIVVKPAYDKVEFYESMYGVVYKGEKKGVINDKGILIIRPAYDHIEKLADGYLAGNKGKFGYITKEGKLSLPLVYDRLKSPDGEFIILKRNDKYGIGDKAGKILLPLQYDEVITDYKSSKASPERSYIVIKEDKHFLFDLKTKKLSSFDSNTLENVIEGELTAPPPMVIDNIDIGNYKKQIQEKFGADEVIPLLFEADYSTGFFFNLVTKDGKKGLVRSTDDVSSPMVPFIYDAVEHIVSNRRYSFYSGNYLIAVSKDGVYGIINDKGETIVPFQYDHIRMFRNYNTGFELEKAGKKGLFLPSTFYPIIEPKYDNISFAEMMFVNQDWNFALYKVIQNGKMGYVGENGVEYFK